MKPAPPNARYYGIPAYTKPVGCRGATCMENIYFVPSPKSDATVPVSCDVAGTFPPKGNEPGKGISHFQVCPDANAFTKEKK